LTIGYREERNPPSARWRELLDHLEEFEDDEEPTAVSLTCADTEWCLGTFVSGHTVWMNLSYARLGHGQPRHMAGVPRDKVFALWELLAAGRFDEIDREPWLPGAEP
jgi:hypothetical protein